MHFLLRIAQFQLLSSFLLTAEGSWSLSIDYKRKEKQPRSIKTEIIVLIMVSFQRAQKGACSSISCCEQRAAPPGFPLHCSSKPYPVWKHVSLVRAGTGLVCFCPLCYIFQSGL